ncbi:hypothetical protein A3D00_01745 [Candidatus Woesebacteria bacterium RIFCSPHIGHO2_02_FULL_38_9]|uniref:DUF5678 domain-containing protein n=1 Tax=Candidatus Woesebacteria bacterium RIFCSPHIGHO2_01_FULL_39_28 TaxID=1802496 RepID=A0A1F7YG34_9BACT|nr:MAG: hypothetical protein A2627_03705 [Candidatus Woesebacteria bacterium RIFCSPHIGHO2_01_FULL_39_28]OGM33651.1 MAG: hypothetical protein A3D00_01745 [Candidatus Woesebacteria bacterium RIFCSPHIGHO2_02_FULL_38_9]OGM58528.1 MAG: hypothetical protein A3A50_00715 [Candidatus Woesebacteria bacterium RIFCSPLOWO2_01_FULL_38_20]
MKARQKKLSNYEFSLKVNTSAYENEWIAIANKKIVAHGKDAESVYKKAKNKSRSKNILLVKEPPHEMLVLKIIR